MLVFPPRSESHAIFCQNRPGMLCIWGTDHMDGQKTIWLEQMKNLNRVRLLSNFVNVAVSSSN